MPIRRCQWAPTATCIYNQGRAHEKPTPCPCLPAGDAISRRLCSTPPMNSLALARNPTVLVRLQGPFSAANLLRHCLVGTASEDVNHWPRTLASAHSDKRILIIGGGVTGMTDWPPSNNKHVCHVQSMCRPGRCTCALGLFPHAHILSARCPIRLPLSHYIS